MMRFIRTKYEDVFGMNETGFSKRDYEEQGLNPTHEVTISIKVPKAISKRKNPFAFSKYLSAQIFTLLQKGWDIEEDWGRIITKGIEWRGLDIREIKGEKK